MDNFDHTKVTSSGIGGSYDTILMLSQNQNKKENSSKTLSEKTDRLTKKLEITGQNSSLSGAYKND